MRKALVLALIGLSVLLSGCSYSTDLAVINLSDQPLIVRYLFKPHSSPFDPRKPSIKAVAEMDSNDQWLELTETQYTIDSQMRSVTLTIAPRTAVLVERVRGPGISEDAESFPINEIVMRGAYGTISLHGEQVRKGFVGEESVYAVTYR